MRFRISKFARSAGAIAASWVAAISHAAAQGCAMCYQNAAASGAHGRAALQRGTLILFFPAIALFGAILWLLYRRRNVAAAQSGVGSESPGSIFVGR
jgi:membrane protease YdiL (CAAX protease family)